MTARALELERLHTGNDALAAETTVICRQYEAEAEAEVFVVLSSKKVSPPVVYAAGADVSCTGWQKMTRNVASPGDAVG
jgi:hypothetical protein